MTTFDYYIKLFVIALAAVAPIIMILVSGYQPSLSTFWKTDMQPLFIITNASTSYHLFAVRNWRWRPSAILLLALTAFSVADYAMAHNILAVLFFVVSAVPLFMTHHFKYMKWVYLAALPLMIHDMLLGEIFAIIALCVYHALILFKIKKLGDR